MLNCGAIDDNSAAQKEKIPIIFYLNSQNILREKPIGTECIHP